MSPLTKLSKLGLAQSQLEHAQEFAQRFEDTHGTSLPTPDEVKLESEGGLVLGWKDGLRHLEVCIHLNGVEWHFHQGNVFEGEDFLTDRTFELLAKWC